MNQAFAICSVILFATLAVLLFIGGTDMIRASVVIALLLGAVGQHLAQADTRGPIVASILITYMAIAMAAIATIEFALKATHIFTS